jgi:hypothetical protein
MVTALRSVFLALGVFQRRNVGQNNQKIAPHPLALLKGDIRSAALSGREASSGEHLLLRERRTRQNSAATSVLTQADHGHTSPLPA